MIYKAFFFIYTNLIKRYIVMLNTLNKSVNKDEIFNQKDKV